MRVWYVNHYATHSGHGRIGRAWYLQKELYLSNHQMVVFHASYHHLMMRKVDMSMENWHSIPCNFYRGNGIGRLLNMMLFAINLIRIGTRISRALLPDIIVYSSPHPFAWISCKILANRLKTPLVSEIRDLWPDSLVQILGMHRLNPMVVFCGLLEKRMIQGSDGVIGLMEGIPMLGLTKGYTMPKNTWVSNGVDSDSAVSAQFDHPIIDRINHWHSEGKKILVHAGSMGQPNGLLVFLKNIKDFSLKKQIQILLIGDGIERPKIEALIKTENYEWITWIPTVDSQIAMYLLTKCDGGLLIIQDLPIYRYGIAMNKLFSYLQAKIQVIAIMPPDVPIVRGPWLLESTNDQTSIFKVLRLFIEMPKENQDSNYAQAVQEMHRDFSWQTLSDKFIRFLLTVNQKS